MLGQDKRGGLTPAFGFVLLMGLVLIAVVCSILLGAPERGQGSLAAFFSEQLGKIAAAAAGEVPADEGMPGGPTPAGRTPVRPTSLVGGGAAAGPTTGPVRLATLRPVDMLRRDHYWLERPIGEPGESRVARFYPYGSRLDGSYPVHYGVEMVNAEGTPVLAPASGVIVAAGSDDQQVFGARSGFYGQLVILQLDQRYQGSPVYVLFGHLSETQVTVGQPVAVGQPLGLVGATGYAEAPHLHSEVRIGKNDYRATVNPELWYKPRSGCGTLAGVLLDSGGYAVDSETKMVLRSAGGTMYDVFTYPLGHVNPDPEWTENFAIGDLEAGAWTLEVFYRNTLYTHDLVIQSGSTTWLVIPTG